MPQDQTSPQQLSSHVVAIGEQDALGSAGLSNVRWVFASTLFMSAALLFLLEPMFAKMVLPYLGGTPAVWNTCVVFFQATMLAGYVYAHVLSKWLSLRAQVALHMLLLVGVFLTLPIVIPAHWAPPVDRSPLPALLRMLAMTAGPPFFVVSATAPLVQQWFSQTDHHSASDPYVLYAASNLGSVTALLAYPLIVERLWRIPAQGTLWEVGYGAFVIGMLLCGVAAATFRRSRQYVARQTVVEPSDTPDPTWAQRLRWLGLSLVPSSLMLAVTTFISTDVAAVPLLWVVPLALYLLSFVNAFSRRPLISSVVANNTVRIAMLPLTLALMMGAARPAALLIGVHIVTFFACALVLHGQLARERPNARHLTAFYLWVSVGGVLGGAFNTLLAPLIFTGITEYPVMLVAACAFGLTAGGKWRPRYQDVVVPLLLASLVAVVIIGAARGVIGTYGFALALGLFGPLYASCAKRPLRLAAAIALMFVVAVLWGPSQGDLLFAERTFFGVLRVRTDDTGKCHRLIHGTTLHGEEAVDPALANEPRTYYHRDGPIGDVMKALSPHLAGASIGVVGLGVGSLAAYSQPGQTWTFYEIDPAVEQIARSGYFRYLSECGARCTVVLGDARLSLAKASAQHDLLILDAFSSDAIPVHLMTREALQLYLRSLKSDGTLAFHITNRNLNLEPVLGAVAQEAGLTSLVRFDAGNAAAGRARSEWLVMMRAPSILSSLAADSRWERPSHAGAVWTDDYSNIVAVLWNRSRP